MEKASKKKCAVLWTSGDKEVAEKMVFMYTLNSKKQKWWDEVLFIIWGPSSMLLSRDRDLQRGVQKMMEAGVVVQACVACANMYGVSEKLANMGIDVKGMGPPLTKLLQDEAWEVLTV